MIVTVTIPDDWTAVADVAAVRSTIGEAIATLSTAYATATALVELPARMEELTGSYVDARDGTPPTPEPGRDVSEWPEWRQPLGTVGIYPLGAVRRVGDRLWRSDRPLNSWRPGDPDSGWTDVTDLLSTITPPEPPTAAPWAPDVQVWRQGDLGSPLPPYPNPTGAATLVEFGGHVYRCLQSHRTQEGWAPPISPALWVLAL